MEIVERRQANGSSLKGEARFRAIFARANIGVALVDRDGYAIESNPALQRMLGYSSDELRRTAFYQFTHPQDIEPDATLFRSMLTGSGEHYQIEKRFFRKSGEVMWGRLSVSLLREKDDGPAFGVAILEDITETRLARQFLDERQKFDAFMANLSARFINLPAGQLDTVIEDAQRNICECLKIDVCTLWQQSTTHPDSMCLTHYHVPPDFAPIPEEMDGKESFPWCLEKLRAGESVILSRVTDAPAAASRDLEGWRHYGVKSALTFPLSAGGGSTFGALGFNTISEEHDWPAELVGRLQLVAQIFANALARRRAEQTLRESEARFRLLADSAPVLIWMSGTDKRCTYFNRTWLEFTGRPVEQELGDGWVEGVHPEDRQRCLDTYVGAFDAREPFVMEYRLRRRDGEYRWLLDNGVPQFGADHGFTGYIGSCIDITERKLAEEALQKSEERILALVEHTSDLIWSVDAKTFGLLTFNGALRDYFFRGRGFEIRAGMTPEQLLPPDYAAQWHEFYARALRDGAFDTEYVTSTKSHVLLLSFNCLKLRGEVFGISVFGRDITESKRAEEVLNQTLQFNENLIQTANVMIIGLDLEGNVTLFNPKAERLTGYTWAELEGKNWFELLVPRDKYPWVHREFSRLSTGGLPKFLQNPIRTKSGEERFVAWSNNELVRDGRIVGSISFGVDITEEKQAQERLRESRVLIKAVFSSLYGHVAVLDRNGYILAVNDSWGRFAQENQGSFATVGVGANYLDVCRRAMTAGDAIAGKALKGIESVLDGEREEFVIEYPCVSQAQARWFEMVVHPLRRPEGGALVTHINISGRRQAEIEVHSLRHELSRVARVTMMGELTASLAHELNQPLTAILSNAQTARRMLEGPAPSTAEISDILDDIVSDDQRAGDIIAGLRSLLKKNELNFLPLDVNGVILQVVGLIRSDAVIRNVPVVLHLTPDLPVVRGDRVQLQQVMLNLAINAFDAMKDIPVSERRLEITTMRIETHSVQVAVHDTGMGIAHDQIDRIFEPFFTTKSHGLGMGLAICRSIIQMHGGRIWAANGPGRGAICQFVLPINGDSTL